MPCILHHSTCHEGSQVDSYVRFVFPAACVKAVPQPLLDEVSLSTGSGVGARQFPRGEVDDEIVLEVVSHSLGDPSLKFPEGNPIKMSKS